MAFRAARVGRPSSSPDVRAPGSRGVDQGMGLGHVHRAAMDGQRCREARAPAPPIAPRCRLPRCRSLQAGPVERQGRDDRTGVSLNDGVSTTCQPGTRQPGTPDNDGRGDPGAE